MNNQYIVLCYIKLFDGVLYCYIKRVVSYKNSNVKITVDINKAHKYKTQDAAAKAALNFNGEIKVI